MSCLAPTVMRRLSARPGASKWRTSTLRSRSVCCKALAQTSGAAWARRKVRLRIRNRESQLAKAVREPLPFFTCALPAGRGVGLVGERRRSQRLGDGVHVEAVAGLVPNRFDEAGVAEQIAHAQAGQRIALGERAQEQQVVVGAQQRQQIVVQGGINEVHIRFVHQQHAAQVGGELRDRLRIGQRAGRRVRIDEADELCLRGVEPRREVRRQRPVLLQGNLDHRAVLHRGQHGIQGIARRRHAERGASVQKGGDRKPQGFVAAVGDDDLGRFQSESLGDRPAQRDRRWLADSVAASRHRNAPTPSPLAETARRRFRWC